MKQVFVYNEGLKEYVRKESKFKYSKPKKRQKYIDNKVLYNIRNAIKVDKKRKIEILKQKYNKLIFDIKILYNKL